jgi:Flp pilus assembly pilin Flp
MIKQFLMEEDGLGTVELLLILAGLVSVALIFKNQLKGFMDKAKTDIFGPANSGTATFQ